MIVVPRTAKFGIKQRQARGQKSEAAGGDKFLNRSKKEGTAYGEAAPGRREKKGYEVH